MLSSADNMKTHVQHALKDDMKTLETKEISTKFITDVLASLTFGIEINSFKPEESLFYRQCKYVSSTKKVQKSVI